MQAARATAVAVAPVGAFVSQARLVHTLHQPCALTRRPLKIEHGPLACPAMPEYSVQVLQFWPAA